MVATLKWPESASARFDEFVERLFNNADEETAYAVNSCRHAVKIKAVPQHTRAGERGGIAPTHS
jgi:hypothetical protein